MDVLRIASDAGNQGRVFDAAYRRADKSSRGVLCGHDEASYLKKYSRVVSASATNICKLARLRFTSTTVPSCLPPYLITLSARIPILDFRFWILDSAVIGLLDPLSRAQSVES